MRTFIFQLLIQDLLDPKTCFPIFNLPSTFPWEALVAQQVKTPPEMQETPIGFLGGEDPLEKEMATHCSILTWRIPWMEEPGGLQSVGSQRVGHDLATKQ